ncbi:RNA methyltransferase [Synechocystis sp. PCC 7509]|uniref:RNA methyltransferase n=1 Tax=Synechocystis sp. PCC 7509 TaxID=927677 RepID=UPI0002ABDA87|nr:RNA methyltransferase [Synechocystis sp. PCC 7509]
MFTHSQKLASVRIVLVEPAGDRNIGAIARVMKNFGLQQLILVNPQCDPHSEDAQQMAVHAQDVLAAAQIVETLPEALQGCVRAIATTARFREQLPLEHPHRALPWLLETPLEQPSALIFGPECRGLSNQELNYAQRFVCIPSNPDYSSLNLAQAVAVCCYELTQSVEFSTGDRTETPDYAAFDELEAYYQHLQQVLLTIGYIYPHTAASRMEKFRHIFNRAYLDKNELNMLRGILTQMQWALQKNAKPE